MRPSRRRTAPAPPPLPVDKGSRTVPPAVRELVNCRGNQVTLEPGPVPWLELSLGMLPSVMYGNGMRQGTIRITITLDAAVDTPKLTLVAEVRHGLLRLDTSRLREFPTAGNPRPAIEAWVTAFNAWLAHNREKLGPLKLSNGSLTVTKL